MNDAPGVDAPTLGEVVAEAAQRLRDAGDDTARLDAELLAAEALGLTRVQVFTRSAEPLDPQHRDLVQALIERRLAHEPVAYILGRAGFRNLELQVDRRVLIPRPETELLVEWTLEACRRAPQPARVLDVGTGSGAIAIAVAQEAVGIDVHVTATDVSPAALDLARHNSERAGVDVDFRCGNLFDPVADERFDVIVSNPPYVRHDEADTLAPDVYRYEPHVALFVHGDDPQALARLLAYGARDHLRPGGLLAIEIGHEQAAAVMDIFRSAGLSDVSARSDLQGIDRAIAGRWYGGAQEPGAVGG